MLPLQKRFLPLSKIVDFHFWYYRTETKTTRCLKIAKLTSKSATEIDMGRAAFDNLDDLRRNNLIELEKVVRLKLVQKRFTSFAEAERTALEAGKFVQTPKGIWRGTVNINGVKAILYNATKALVARDIAVTLLQEFPSES